MASVIVNGEYRGFTVLTDSFEDAGEWLLEGYAEGMGLAFVDDDESDLYGYAIPEEDFPKWEDRARLFAATSSIPEELYEEWSDYLSGFDFTDDFDHDIIRISEALITRLVGFINGKEN